MSEQPINIYLADLTHTGTVISSNIFPLAIGLIGAYLEKHLDPIVKIELFKDPDELNRRLQVQAPAIIGFSNYSWNEQISLAFARRVKAVHPEVVTIVGGPNYGLEDEEVKSYWAGDRPVDFYIIKEGEEAMLQLVKLLLANNFDVKKVKEGGHNIANAHYCHEGKIVTGSTLARISVGELPSPYLSGLMDKFFGVGFIPMIYTTRGCPFSCAFCTEGSSYYDKVSQRQESLEEELNYIASRVDEQADLFIADANFGMFKQDVHKAELIRGVKAKFRYPKNLIVSTGKNQKERVLNVASMLDGSLNLAASVQSTDEQVLENARRSNISLATLKEVGAKASAAATGTYTEIILGLPGDSRASHFKTLKDTIDAGFDIIRMYQFILLPQTEFNTPEAREKYDIKSRHRIMPRSFGHYEILGEKMIISESEQISISNRTMCLEDYLECREMDLVVEVIHNGKMFGELAGLFKGLKLSWFDFLEYVFDARHIARGSISNIFQRFKYENTEYLCDTVEDIQALVKQQFDFLVNDEINTNEMSAAKAQAVFFVMPDVHDFAFQCARRFISDHEALEPHLGQYLEELERFSSNRKLDFFSDCNKELLDTFSYDFLSIGKNGYEVDFRQHQLSEKRRIKFSHSMQQRQSIDALRKEYGTSLSGLSKLAMRQPHIYRLFREASWIAA